MAMQIKRTRRAYNCLLATSRVELNTANVVVAAVVAGVQSAPVAQLVRASYL